MLAGSRTGLYATACEKSPNKHLIDQWLNESKSNAEISRRLKALGENISDKSVGKYRSYRDEAVQKELMADPLYQKQIAVANQSLVDEVSKFKQINVINHLAETVEHCAELITQSQLDEIKIRNIQDLRYVQTTMLESLKLYGDTILQAQQFAKIEEDPELLRPTQNIQVKNVLLNVLGGMDNESKLQLVDRLREGIRESDS